MRPVPIRPGKLDIITAIVLPLLACDTDRPASSGTEEVGGVEVPVVESAEPAWGEGEGWTVAANPLVEIGAADGPAPYLFAAIRSPRLLPDGRIVVGDARANEIRFFDEDGRFIRAVGRSGQGPGEFEILGRLWLAPDSASLMVTVAVADRITRMDFAGNLLELIHIPNLLGGRAPNAIGQFGNGRFFGLQGSSPPRPRSGHGTTFRGSVRLVSWRGEGQDARAHAELASDHQWLRERQDGGTSYPVMPFAARGAYAVGAGRAYAGESAEPAIMELDPAGGVTRILHWGAEPREVTAGDRDWLVDDYVRDARDENDARQWRRDLAEIPFPDHMPYYEGLLVDASGNLWVQRYRTEADDGPVLWDVFAKEGRWLGPVEVPSGLRVEWISEDRMVGVHYDDLGVGRVRVYALEKEANGRRAP
ncbi:MAG: 6-bladed beta-propeller [Gemmatimonadota bacterium]